MAVLLNTHPTQTVKVLLVEDEFILAINLQESLETLGYSVLDIADSAELAIEKATELSPDLILMDIRLRGGMDGIQAAEYIWNHLQIPVIYVTGHSDTSTLDRAMLTSPFGYILKPIKDQELYLTIQTALKRYEREQFLNHVLQNLGDGVIVVDNQLQIKYLNQVAEALTGWQLDEAKNQKLTDILTFIDEQTQLTTANSVILALEQETNISLENSILLITRHGNTIPIADSATPLKDKTGEITGVVMVFRDDTQRRLEQRNLAAELTQKIEIQNAKQQRLNQLKDNFLATISHELRTPLSNIKMAINMLENTLDRQNILKLGILAASASVNYHLNLLRQQCEYELNLVDDLLNLRMIDADIYPLELTSIQLQDWLPQVVENFQASAQAKQQILQVSVSPDLPPLLSDLSILTQIVSELLKNAQKYSPINQHIQVTAQLTDTTNSELNKDAQWDGFDHPQASYLQITVSNYGVEISPNQIFRIFEPFYRIPNNNTIDELENLEPFDLHQNSPWRHDGTGLGLALVRKLVNYIQGTIAVTSTQDCTNFTVQIPLIFLTATESN